MTLQDSLKRLAAGQMVILVGPLGEADLVAAAETITPELVNFMVTHARGIVAAALPEDRLRELGIPLLSGRRGDLRETPAVGASVEARHGVSTGISASDRALTLRALASPTSRPQDFMMPGHVPPLASVSGGVMVRAGRAEAAVDLMRLAGKRPCAALCEILTEQGEAARGAELEQFAAHHRLPVCTVESLVAYRRTHEVLVRRVSEVDFALPMGKMRALVYRNIADAHEHLTLLHGRIQPNRPTLVRIHSECLTGDVFGSRRCDCGEQLQESLARICQSPAGILIYLHQEGRGIGLGNKIRAYALQDRGLDTVEANLELGFKEDMREYGIGAQILRDLQVGHVMLLTNNPDKVEGLRGHGLEVTRVALEAPAHSLNIQYLRTKQLKLGHLFSDLKVNSR
ncbi:MAG TPA: GTP cyclohydrolase II [Candidatus Binataceae bacterium]|nr:GTP cyclohydrolase II [Candidatus Binataceae bacterium]